MILLDIEYRMNKLNEEIELIEKQAIRMSNFVVRRDLTKMIKNVNDQLTEISNESVKCRQLNKTSTRLSQLTKIAEDSVRRVQKYVTLAMLID